MDDSGSELETDHFDFGDIHSLGPQKRRKTAGTTVKSRSKVQNTSSSRRTTRRIRSYLLLSDAENEGNTVTSPAHSGAAPSAPTNQERHPVHWYDDGNLLIELDGVQFNLHWSLMAKHSTFFRERYERGLTRKTAVIKLDGRGFTVESFAALLDRSHFSYGNEDTLKSILSILSVSHALSFHDTFNWAKNRLILLWSIDKDFTNLPILVNFTAEEAKASLRVARACQIHEVVKPALYAVLRLPLSDFKGEERQSYEQKTGIDLLQGREHLSSHWKDVIGRLRLASCSHQSRNNPSPSGSMLPPNLHCTSNDPIKSDLVHHRLLYKNGTYERYRNDPLLGLHTLKSQLFPPSNTQTSDTTADVLRRKRKRTGEPDFVVDDSTEKKPVTSPWANTESGGYCEGCLTVMWFICLEAIGECWEKLDEWAGLKVEQVKDNDR
ncbi:hypothetical protein BDN72DRAFT_834145 [Pluteus cervinus]|uniref:Uncharacterized protein n=1 Tax=Pluteus cervinus TaxID=181527 RepID=A0ACD3B7I3_9AGAR|nr:hypothetical protein BDN72DRAFT_834145 [Pluteus cervinus]